MKHLHGIAAPMLLATIWCATAVAQTCQDADLLLHNGHIVTMNAAQSVVGAMTVRDGRILALGDNNTLARCATSRIQSLDLHGRTVLPGLIDVHTHAMEWVKSILRGEIDTGYPAVHSIPDIAQAVAHRAAAIPLGEWIIGSGWDDAKLVEHRYITRKDLDRVSPGHPVYLKHGSGHLGVANSAALRLAKITRDTNDPQGGVISATIPENRPEFSRTRRWPWSPRCCPKIHRILMCARRSSSPRRLPKLA